MGTLRNHLQKPNLSSTLYWALYDYDLQGKGTAQNTDWPHQAYCGLVASAWLGRSIRNNLAAGECETRLAALATKTYLFPI